jgi:hypothetical protein
MPEITVPAKAPAGTGGTHGEGLMERDRDALFERD